MLKILIAGGGTGGHIFPALAIAKALEKKAAVSLLFVGAKGKMEMEKIPQAGYKINGIDIAGYNRANLFKNFSLPFKLIKSFWQVNQILNNFKPDAVIGVGGYSSFPVLRTAQRKGIPTFIHESNSLAGKSNQLLAKKVQYVFVAFEDMQKYFPQEKIIISGNPVRDEIINNKISKDEALKYFGLLNNKKTILILGGSLGAKSINNAIAKNIASFSDNGLQLIWQTGQHTYQQYKHLAEGTNSFWIQAFIEKMNMVYAAADVVVSRAGALSVAELCVVKKPVVFVPYPYAAEDHQTVNAQYLVQKNAARLVKDNEADTGLVPAILDLIQNVALQETLSKNIASLAKLNAADMIAEKILETIQ
ncbi:MAG: undecaprenyldiphospho-muramoylpentapeptide beta-N-acetylglucosaminyltransferase [Sphingobacteriales bacterium]|uniref:undecaprenyldiphospho-muramoylpentapeptide beta-N-acetylglucosaminyltransferase n=1 Tax=Hydrotalea flava TaxID=714549 RepID=UPI00082ED88F|nr:undecaprenyldiphospho-muramoylpentapeptide beta-N-acetylglucosaminyltransferase [Hydrotalea flava]RTL55108.1 MAG: undecaprenyldiphospho-muramoylpentapeptide beta-N-acetylglucosaminyltransferase [Sphingobacteriales bacterium]